jgi:hypothetical protein
MMLAPHATAVNPFSATSSGSVWLWHAHLARDSRAGRPCHSFKLAQDSATGNARIFYAGLDAGYRPP